PDDMRHFMKKTKSRGGNVLLGNTTFQKGLSSMPLPGRHNFVLTSRDQTVRGATTVHDLVNFLNSFKDKDLWIAGGASVYRQVMDLGLADELYLTHIEGDFNCDSSFPRYEERFKLAAQSHPQHQNGFTFKFARYVKK
ncbi:MAG: dihydrofolate reductase, partial [Candidatus Saccharimonadales bacterium]